MVVSCMNKLRKYLKCHKLTSTFAIILCCTFVIRILMSNLVIKLSFQAKEQDMSFMKYCSLVLLSLQHPRHASWDGKASHEQ